MIKIAIIELAGHFEVARAYAKMALHSGYYVVMLVNESNYSQLKDVFEPHDSLEWKVSPDDAMDDFLVNNKSILDQCAMVLCCTPEQKNGKVISKLWNAKSYLVVHDVNNYFAVVKNIHTSGGLRQYLRIAKYYFSGYFSKRKKALQTFDGVIVPSALMKSYADTLQSTHAITTLPFLYNEHSTSQFNHKHTTIVIPGTVNQRSRDYHMVYAILQEMHQAGFDQKIKLVLLGQCKGQAAIWIKNNFLKMAIPWLEVVTYDTALPQAEYDSLMWQADFFALPLQQRWQYGIVDEVGGTSCLSGNIGDMVRYGMPVLLPSNYPLPQELLPLVTYYDKDVANAAKTWSDYIKNKSYNRIKESSGPVLIAINEWLKSQMSALATAQK